MTGRKNKYFTHVEPYLEQIAAWCRDGATDEDIYIRLNVSKDSFYRYKNEHSDLSDLLKRNKEIVDIAVENALYKRAIGYTYDEVTKERVTNPDTGETDIIETKRVTKEVHPDTTAQIFWLKNRKPREWRDKQDIESININKNIDFDISNLTAEQQNELFKITNPKEFEKKFNEYNTKT